MKYLTSVFNHLKSEWHYIGSAGVSQWELGREVKFRRTGL
ncbi:hypothetical protein SHAM105786_11435 [Shewanella amazonensis]